MKLEICIWLAVLLFLVQVLNGYLLNCTKLYSPIFVYYLISVEVIVGWIGLALMYHFCK